MAHSRAGARNLTNFEHMRHDNLPAGVRPTATDMGPSDVNDMVPHPEKLADARHGVLAGPILSG